MRLFIALLLAEPVIESMSYHTRFLLSNTRQGKPTPRSNIHATLAFLGECDESCTKTTVSLVSTMRFDPFVLEFNQMGMFKQGKESLWWIGSALTPRLSALRDLITSTLDDAGIWFDRNPFVPHATIARRVVLKPGILSTDICGQIKPVHQVVDSVHLMQSSYCNGVLSHIRLASTKIQPATTF